jgi:hypothetical protein
VRLLAGIVLLCACSDEIGRPPVARVTVCVMTSTSACASPYIPTNDTFTTPILVDGSTSADEVDDPNATRPLEYHWTIGGDYKIKEGTLDSSKFTMLLKGDRPVPVTLSATDTDDHLTAKETVTIGITLRP